MYELSSILSKLHCSCCQGEKYSLLKTKVGLYLFSRIWTKLEQNDLGLHGTNMLIETEKWTDLLLVLAFFGGAL